MPSINYGNTTIHYCHYKQTRKDVKISIYLVMESKFLHQKTLRSQTSFKSSSAKHHGFLRSLRNCEKLPYLDRHYRLKIKNCGFCLQLIQYLYNIKFILFLQVVLLMATSLHDNLFFINLKISLLFYYKKRAAPSVTQLFNRHLLFNLCINLKGDAELVRYIAKSGAEGFYFKRHIDLTVLPQSFIDLF